VASCPAVGYIARNLGEAQSWSMTTLAPVPAGGADYSERIVTGPRHRSGQRAAGGSTARRYHGLTTVADIMRASIRLVVPLCRSAQITPHAREWRR